MRPLMRHRLSAALLRVEKRSSKKWLRRVARQGRIIVEVGRGVIFRNGDRAATLTYFSLLSIVPLLALVFSLLDALGGLEGWQDRVRVAFVQYLAPASQVQAQRWLDDFITHFKASTIGALSFGILFVTLLFTFLAIEDAFNHIWLRRGRRSLLMRALTMFIALPIMGSLLGASVLITGATHSLAGVAWVEAHVPAFAWTLALLPLIATSLAFAFAYRLVPFAPVSNRAALFGGLSAGVGFEIAKALYAIYAVRSIGKNALYGSLAALPVFMVWVNYSWRVVLFGAEVAHASQYIDDGPANDEREAKNLTALRPRAIARG